MKKPQKRIAIAFAVGMVLVTGAFLLSRQMQAPDTNLASASSALVREHIKVTDSDGDTVPDWQDALLGDNPIDLTVATTSTYEPPKSVTGKVAVGFIQNFLNAKRYSPFGDSNEEIVQKATKELTEASKDALFVESDIILIDTTDKNALRAYGNQVADILLSANTGKESELYILQDALRYKEEEKLKELEPIREAYGTMVLKMTTVSVPLAYKEEHLNLLNALSAIQTDINAMRNVNDDALYALMRLKRYHDDVLGLSNTITILFDTLYTIDGVQFREGDKTLQLVTFAP